jgi:hypothetical protein
VNRYLALAKGVYYEVVAEDECEAKVLLNTHLHRAYDAPLLIDCLGPWHRVKEAAK